MENEFNNQNQTNYPSTPPPNPTTPPDNQPAPQTEMTSIDSTDNLTSQNSAAQVEPVQISENLPTDNEQPQSIEPATPETSLMSSPISAVEPMNSYKVDGITVGGPSITKPDFNQQQPDQNQPKVNFLKRFKKLVVASGALVLLIIVVVVFYFAYWMNPNVIYSQALSNSSTGLDNLISYAKIQSNSPIKGTSTFGNLSYGSGASKITGNISQLSDGRNSKLSLNLNVSGQNLTFNGMEIANSSGTPDLYLKLAGFSKILSSLSNAASPYSKLDNQWIEVNHTILNQLNKSSIAAKTPTSADIISAANSIALVNKQYLFNSSPKYSVLTVVKNYGIELVNNQSAYHYKVGLVKANLKNYITALQNAFAKTYLASWLSKSSGQSLSNLMGSDSLLSSVNSITSADTFDMWVSTGLTRYITQIKVPTSSTSSDYVIAGLKNYDGAKFPFYLGFSSGGNSITINSLIDTKSNQVVFNISGSGASLSSLSLNLTLKPNSTPVNVTAPAGAISLEQALNEAGLGSYYQQLISNLSTL